MKKTASYKWRLNETTNECQKVKPGFKFQMGLGIIMICAMIAGVLYLVLDDKYFCLGGQRVEKAASQRAPTQQEAQKKTGLAGTIEDDQKSLCR